MAANSCPAAFERDIAGELAAKLYLSQTNLSNIENGKTRPTMKNIFKIRGILGCSMIDFFEDGISMKEMGEALRWYRKFRRA